MMSLGSRKWLNDSQSFTLTMFWTCGEPIKQGIEFRRPQALDRVARRPYFEDVCGTVEEREAEGGGGYLREREAPRSKSGASGPEGDGGRRYDREAPRSKSGASA